MLIFVQEGSRWKQDKNGDDRDETGGRGTMQREAKTQGNQKDEVEDSDEDKEDTEKPPWEQVGTET